MSREKEIWKPVIGYENTYLVSSLGRIRRSDNKRLLNPDSGQAYLQVCLSQDNKKWVRAVHLIVARAFLGECPIGYEVNHKDLNTRNNRLSNLEYVTHIQNIHHAQETRRLQLKKRFIAIPEAAKLKNVSEETIREWCKRGYLKGAYKSGKIWVIPVKSLEKRVPMKVGKRSANYGKE